MTLVIGELISLRQNMTAPLRVPPSPNPEYFYAFMARVLSKSPVPTQKITQRKYSAYSIVAYKVGVRVLSLNSSTERTRMPVRYNISLNLKLVIYFCSGLVSGADIFETSEKIIRDKRRISGLITIIDFLDAVENIQWGELQEAIRRIESLTERGVVIGPIVIISQSRGMQVLVDTINLLPHKLPFKLDMVYSIEEAISSLGLSDSEEEIIQFWNESKSLSA